MADMVRGVAVSWTLAACAVLGAALMFRRLTLGTEGSMADSDHLVGALVVTISVIALAEVARPVRFLNVLFGAWLVVAPWMLEGAGTVAAVASVLLGVALIALSLPRGPRSREHYAGWDYYIV